MTVIARLLSLFVVPDRERLRHLLVPELADLRQQLDQARRLAGEAQRKYRESGKMLLDEIRQKLAMMDERDRLREQLTMEVKNATRLATEGDQLRARVAELEAGPRAKAGEPRPMITTIKGQSPRPRFTADGQPIAYVNDDEQPTRRHFPKPGGFYP